MWVKKASCVGMRASTTMDLRCHKVGLLYKSERLLCVRGLLHWPEGLLYRPEGFLYWSGASYIGQRPPLKPENLLYQQGASYIGQRASCIH